MERMITLSVLGNTYHFNVKSPEDEENFRKAAKSLESMARKINEDRPGTTDAETGRMLALNKGIEAEKLKKEIRSLNEKINRLNSEAEGLHKELDSYLDNNVYKNSR